MAEGSVCLAVGARIRAQQQHVDSDNSWRMTQLAPLTQLSDAIDGYCDYEEVTGGFCTRRELPHAQGVLIINLGPSVQITAGDGRLLGLRAGEGFLAGVHLRPALSHSAGRQMGMQVQLPLSTLYRLTGVPMQQLLDQVVALDVLLPAPMRRFFQQMAEQASLGQRVSLLDEALTRLLKDTELDRRDMAALNLLQSQSHLDISAVAERVNLSRKQLALRITRLVGVGPRCYRRLLRFQKAHACLRMQAGQAVDWSALAIDCEYFDQSHLIREFREFAGLTPAQCLARTLTDGGGLVEA